MSRDVVGELRRLMREEEPPGDSGDAITIQFTKSECDLLRAMHRHLPALLAVAEAARDNLQYRHPLGIGGGTQNLSGDGVIRADIRLHDALSALTTDEGGTL